MLSHQRLDVGELPFLEGYDRELHARVGVGPVEAAEFEFILLMPLIEEPAGAGKKNNKQNLNATEGDTIR